MKAKSKAQFIKQIEMWLNIHDYMGKVILDKILLERRSWGKRALFENKENKIAVNSSVIPKVLERYKEREHSSCDLSFINMSALLKRAELFRHLFYGCKDGFYKKSYMDLWYAALYIVTEGYKKLGYQDKIIDNLLTSENLFFLEQYRHSVFDFHKKYWNFDLTLSLYSSQDSVIWIKKLHDSYSELVILKLKLIREEAN